MSDKLVFDYYYGKEAEQFSFYRIPRMLIKDPHFATLSNDAKMLYGLMLDRMSLSVRNGWQDDDDRTYIIYTIDTIMEDLNCSKGTAVKILSELDVKKGIGLIEKVRPGLGKPDIIYVKNFVGITIVNDINEDECDNDDIEMDEFDDKVEYENDCDYAVDEDNYNGKTAGKARKFTEVQKLDFKKSKNRTSRSLKNELQEVQKSNFKKSKNQTSGSSKNGLQEVQNLDPNYNNNNYTDFSNTEYNQTNKIYTETENISSNPIYPNEAQKKKRAMDKMDEIARTTEYVKDIIYYDDLCEEAIERGRRYDIDTYDELIDVMVSAMTSKQPYLNIGGEDVPIQQVKSRFEKYNYNLICYVRDCLANNTTKVKNIRKYMLATLFNAPRTINTYYRAEVMHDFYGGD